MEQRPIQRSVWWVSCSVSYLLLCKDSTKKDNTEQSTADWFGILLATVATRINLSIDSQWCIEFVRLQSLWCSVGWDTAWVVVRYSIAGLAACTHLCLVGMTRWHGNRLGCPCERCSFLFKVGSMMKHSEAWCGRMWEAAGPSAYKEVLSSNGMRNLTGTEGVGSQWKPFQYCWSLGYGEGRLCRLFLPHSPKDIWSGCSRANRLPESHAGSALHQGILQTVHGADVETV